MAIKITHEAIHLTKLRKRFEVAFERLMQASDAHQFSRTSAEAGQLEEIGEHLITLAVGVREKVAQQEWEESQK